MISPWFGNQDWIVTQDWGCTDVPAEPYNWRHPECSRWHEGIDVVRGYGTVGCGDIIYAGRECIVQSIGGSETYYGPYYVTLNLSDGTEVILAHVQETYVTPGQSLNVGDAVAAVGTLGASTGCHLHFEVRPQGGGYGTSIDPHAYLEPLPTPAPVPAPVEIQEDNLMEPVTVAPGTVEWYPVAIETDTFTTDWNVIVGPSDPTKPQSDCQVVVIAVDVKDNTKVWGTKAGTIQGNVPNTHGPSQLYGDTSVLGVPAGTPVSLGFENKGLVPVKYVVHREKK